MVTFLRCVLALYLMMSFQSLFAQGSLAVDVSRADKQWGQFMRVTLRYQGEKKLDDIDLSSWRELTHVYIEDQYNEVNHQGNTVQKMLFRLFPRKIGTITLPPLHLGGAKSDSLELTSMSPRVEESDIQIRRVHDSANLWQRQAFEVEYTLVTHDYSATVDVDELTDDRFIGSVEINRLTNKGSEYRHVIRWKVYPMQAGTHQLDLPPVRYKLSGSDRRQFYFPLINLEIQSIPNYIPPVVPVGNLSIMSEIDQHDSWVIHIQSDALKAYGIPEVDKQLAKLSGTDVTNISITHTSDSITYKTKLPGWLSPFGRDVLLQIRHFDPGKGKLADVYHKLPRTLLMPVWGWITFYIALFSLAVILLLKARPRYESWRQKKLLRSKIRSASDTSEIRQLILQYSHTNTLSRWAGDSKEFSLLAYKLNEACFSTRKQEYDEKLRKEVLNVI